MAKSKADLVTDLEDEEPGRGTPPATATIQSSRPIPPAGVEDSGNPAKAAPKSADFPWGWLVKHPGYGALRVRRDEANNTDEAVEVFRKKKCPGVKPELLAETGMRATALAFVPAATERGK